MPSLNPVCTHLKFKFLLFFLLKGKEEDLPVLDVDDSFDAVDAVLEAPETTVSLKLKKLLADAAGYLNLLNFFFFHLLSPLVSYLFLLLL